jgi:hypothetical protein
MKGWYAKDQGTGHWLLKDDIREKTGLMATKKAVQVRRNTEKLRSILKDHPETASQIVDCLKGMRLASQQIDSSIIRTTIQGVIVAGVPELFDRVVGKGKDGQPVKFSVSKTFAKAFAQRHLGWTWRRMTGAAKKLLEDWVVQGEEMAFWVAVLCSMHSIPDCLVVNSDQTGVHLKPFSEQTYEVKGAKQVLSLGKEDKHQFMVLRSATADGVLLPLQVVFQGKTGQVLPKTAAPVIVASEGWHFTHSANHWSTQETMRSFVQKVLHPYFEGKCFDLGLNPLTQRMIWLIDCWSVHISAEFRGFMKENFPHILLLFVPANCTSKLQVMDVVFQRPFKHAIHQLYNQF